MDKVQIIRNLLEVMELQEARERGEAHLTQEAMMHLWKQRKAEARQAIR